MWQHMNSPFYILHSLSNNSKMQFLRHVVQNQRKKTPIHSLDCVPNIFKEVDWAMFSYLRMCKLDANQSENYYS